MLKYDFKSTEEVDHFFKVPKPVIVSKFIYYNAIYKIETRKSYGTKRTVKYLHLQGNPNLVYRQLKLLIVMKYLNLKGVFSTYPT
ncbi:RteC domain-containing protein [Elizabethkingia ursingii]|uniref:RteC domain-containing protein n=1 Tax=Elizabethkingia ursingii TaxID=1756150 RepID=UPI0021CDA9E5|nr:RteC domain-containing protein [Elizabethkingia ursingii]